MSKLVAMSHLIILMKVIEFHALLNKPLQDSRHIQLVKAITSTLIKFDRQIIQKYVNFSLFLSKFPLSKYPHLGLMWSSGSKHESIGQSFTLVNYGPRFLNKKLGKSFCQKTIYHDVLPKQMQHHYIFINEKHSFGNQIKD